MTRKKVVPTTKESKQKKVKVTAPLRKFVPYEKEIGGVNFVFDKGTGAGLMTKYTEETMERVYDLLKDNDYTITSLCEKVGIGVGTYELWMREPEKYKGFKLLIKACEEKRLSKLRCITRNSILKKAEGWEVEEVTKSKGTTAKGVPFENTTTTKKIIPPDTALLTWLAENLESDIFKNRQEIRHTGYIGSMNVEVEANKLKGLGVDKLRELMNIVNEVEKNNNPTKI